MGGMEGTMLELAASMGTLWTLRMEPLGAMRNCGGAMGPISWGICCMGYPGIAGYPYWGGYLKIRAQCVKMTKNEAFSIKLRFPKNSPN